MKMSPPNPVLVIGEVSLLKSVKDLGSEIILCGENDENLSWYSKYADRKITISAYDTPEFIDELCEIGSELDNKAVIYSDDDRALLNISNNRHRLSNYYLFLYPELEMMQNILDKQEFIRLAEETGIPAPKSFELGGVEEVFEVAEQIPYPCVIKPTQRHFWWGSEFVEQLGYYKKAIKCISKQQLIDTYKKIARINPSVVVQEYVEGADEDHYSANLFVDSNTNIRGYYICRKLRIYPRGAGVGTYVFTIDKPDVYQVCVEVIRKLGLVGLVNLQFKKDERSGEYKLLEIQNRNSMWSLIGNVAGAGLAEMNYRYLTGKNLADKLITAKENVIYVDLIRDIKAFLQYREAGEITFREWLKSLKGEKVFAVFSFRDIGPMLFVFKRYLKSAFKRKKATKSASVPRSEGDNISATPY